MWRYVAGGGSALLLVTAGIMLPDRQGPPAIAAGRGTGRRQRAG